MNSTPTVRYAICHDKSGMLGYAKRSHGTTVHKQTKNRHESGSNLSLGTHLTVLSKRLARKRCCDAIPDRCLGSVPSHYLRLVL